MTTKEKLFSLLAAQRGTYYSGEEIAAQLEISRTAVWKAVKALQADGYEISAVRNRGYCLTGSADVLSAGQIQELLHWPGAAVEVHPSLPSTNALLRERANAGAPEGTVVIAAAQTRGRGRLGRSFYSPADTGLYLSVLLRPEGYSPSEAVRVTTMAAVAACEAVEALSGKTAQIKWVNDVFLEGRKVCGILTEGSFNLELGSLEYIVLGIGINVYPPVEGFPQEIAATAGAVLDVPQEGGRNRLAAEFLNRFFAVYQNDPAEYARRYRDRSLVIGKHITVITPRGTREATALDIDRDCRLVVRWMDGSVESLSSAEISVRI